MFNESLRVMLLSMCDMWIFGPRSTFLGALKLCGGLSMGHRCLFEATRGANLPMTVARHPKNMRMVWTLDTDCPMVIGYQDGKQSL